MKKLFKFVNAATDSKVMVLLEKLFIIEVEKKDDKGRKSSQVHLTGNGGTGSFEMKDSDLEELEKFLESRKTNQ